MLIPVGNHRRRLYIGPAVEQRFQRRFHFRSIGVPVLRIVFTRFQNGPGYRFTSAAGRRQFFPAHAAGQRAFPRSDGKIVFLCEGKAVIVHQAVKRNAQGINVRPLVVGLSAEYFRRHVVGRSLGGKAVRQGVQTPGHAEISQLVENIARGLVVEKDIGGLDIPVNDVLRAAELQCAADVDTDLEDFVLRQDPPAHQIVQRSQQFHPDENVIPDGIRPADQLVVFNPDDMRRSLELFHQLDFRDVLPGNVVVITLALGKIEPFRSQGVRFGLAGRDGNDFDCGVDPGVIPADRAENGRKGSGAEIPVNNPVRRPALRKLNLASSALIHLQMISVLRFLLLLETARVHNSVIIPRGSIRRNSLRKIFAPPSCLPAPQSGRHFSTPLIRVL